MLSGADHREFPTSVARAVGTLRQGRRRRAYGLALSPRRYTGVVETTEKAACRSSSS